MKKTVAIVGSASHTRTLAPWDDLDVHIWGINEALAFPWMKRVSAMFQMHKRWSFSRPNNRNDPHHWEWLQKEHPFPIYMQHKWKDIPSSVKYPYDAIVQALCPTRTFFTSTIAYMIALAIYQSYERIELYGVEQSMDTEYYWQRECTNYWIGKAEGRDIEIYLPKHCTLLSGNIYGYEGKMAIDRMYLDMRRTALQKVEVETLKAMQQAAGKAKMLADLYNLNPTEETRAAFDAAILEERQSMANAAMASGARQENERYIADLDLLLKSAGEAGEEKEYAEDVDVELVEE